ncbi:Imidazole glycerol phosphate synthase amidotransferase subunit HisH [Olavius sp. associated proteobacterium Delta 1]|nr:Imidazole glycerol phosphate synthase amidotransferase subunit HisH [Olavius sp. associated proteobacterium Delta 1]
MIGIIDYGMSNLTSVKNALDYLNIESEISDSPDKFEQYDRLILPGVGAFGLAMEHINQKGFAEALKLHVLNQRKPLLGICLGMQLFLDASEEFGFHQGLGLIKGTVKYFGNQIKGLSVPHVGWNTVEIKKQSSLLDDSVTVNDYSFYFVHGYYCDVADKEAISGLTDYGIKFVSAIEKENIFAVQFHPEKSQKYGLAIFKKFAEI